MMDAIYRTLVIFVMLAFVQPHDLDGLYYNEEMMPHMPVSLVNALPSLRRVIRSADPPTSSAAPETQNTTTAAAAAATGDGKETTGSISVIAVEVQLPRMRARFYTKPKPCCGDAFDEVGKLLLSDEAAHQECIRSVFNGTSKYTKNGTETLPTLEDMRNRVVCVHQCVAEKREVADTNGTLSGESLQKYFTKHLSDGWSADIINKAVDTCMVAKGELAGAICNPAAANMNRCLWRELMLNCPEQKLKKSPRCDLVRQRLKDSRN